MKKLYSIISFNFNNYELLRQVKEKSPVCQYIYITDNKELKSDTWKIIYQNDKLKQFKNVWQKCFYIRYHLFEFCNTDYCIYLDGSIQIKKNLDKLIYDFIKSKSDLGVMRLWVNSSIDEQLNHFINRNSYTLKSKNQQLNLIKLLNYNENNNFFMAGFRICKNTKLNKIIDNLIYDFLCYNGYMSNEPIDRVDETMYSVIINIFFSHIKLFIFSFKICFSSYLQFCYHNSETPYNIDINDILQQKDDYKIE